MNRFVEAMAPVIHQEMTAYMGRMPPLAPKRAAEAAFAALIAELRTDPGAIEAICSVWLPHMKMGDICRAQINALCDYLGAPDES